MPTAAVCVIGTVTVHATSAHTSRTSLAVAAGVTSPSTISQQNDASRKHVATVSQIMNLKRNELDMLASFMGHDLFVHRNYYRLPQDCLEMAKVGKILLAVEPSDMEKFKGKSLDEIDLETGMCELFIVSFE